MKKILLISLIMFFFLGCSKTKVLLLDSGKPNSAVIVSTNKGSQKLDKIGNFVSLKDKDKAPSKPEKMSEEEIKNRFADLFTAAPPKAKSYMLYFKPHSVVLTEESNAVLEQALEDIKKNAPCMVDVIGHTDSVGSNEVNIKVSLKRAKTIESLIKKEQFKDVLVQAKGYGEEDLLVPTGDDVDEAKNRNVEIFIK